VIPDMKYIGRKIAVEAAGDVVSGYLKKATDVQAASAASGSGGEPASKKPPKLKDLLKAIADEAEKNN
jgi:hypothetical protein